MTRADVDAMSVMRMQTADLIRYYYETLNRGDTTALLSCLADDVTHDVNQGERARGPQAFRARLGERARHYKERLDDIVVMVSYDGGRAAAEFMIRGTYEARGASGPKAKGRSYALQGGTFFAIADGKIARITTYYNAEDLTRQTSS